MARGDVHTTLDPDPEKDGWVNQVDGRIVSRHLTKQLAVERGRELAIGKGSEHVIHNKDGTIAEKNSYGPDKYPPKG